MRVCVGLGWSAAARATILDALPFLRRKLLRVPPVLVVSPPSELLLTIMRVDFLRPSAQGSAAVLLVHLSFDDVPLPIIGATDYPPNRSARIRAHAQAAS